MSAYGQIGDACAAGELAAAQACGVQISLSHRGATAATLWATVLEQGIGVDESTPGRQVERGVLLLAIPAQSGFAAMTGSARPITGGDRIEYPLSSGRYFWVTEDPIKMEPEGHVFTVTAIERKTLTQGIAS